MTLPEEFTQYTRQLMGDARFEALTNGLQSEPPVSIRLNPLKCDTSNTIVAGSKGRVAWCDMGIYLDHRPNFTFDPLLHAGVYYVQEASSMFITHVLRQLIEEPVTMLDLCAAPGGKSTACRATMPNGSLLMCNEPIRTRANILSENIQKFGQPDVIVTNNYPRDFRHTGLTFDVILADVPCSGEGMFRKDAGAIAEWSTKNVEKCSRLQREIVTDVWPCLREGGLLIYSTCTFNAHENEENALWIADELGADFVEIETRPEWNITGALTGKMPAYRFLPGTTIGEGLFMTVLRKKANGDKASTTSQSRRQNRKTSPIRLPLTNADEYETRERGDKLMALPTRWAATYDMIAKSLNVVHAGVTIGTRKGKDLVPDQSLALARDLDRKTYAHTEVDYAQAIGFLRKEPIGLPPDTPKGYVLLTYGDHPLGFEKNIGNRANNLYPHEWKIKTTHTPDFENIIINCK